LIVVAGVVGLRVYLSHRPVKPASKPAPPAVTPVVRSWALAPIVIKPDSAAAGSSVPPSAAAGVPSDSEHYQLTPEQ
jgi:hypothetical protein